MVLWQLTLIFAGSIYILVKAADYFTRSAERIGQALNMPNFIIGTVIVAIGTSAPEALTSIFGTAAGETEFLAGNVIGTVLANTLLGLGVAVLLTRKVVRFDWDLISNDLPIFFGAAIFLAVMLIDGQFTASEAIVMFLGYGVYLMYAYNMHKAHKDEFKLERKHKLDWKMVGTFIASLVVLFVASKLVVDSIVDISQILGVGSSVLAASAVAVGTSLPEIAVATVAIRSGNMDLALGDIVGSNIFDLFMIFGMGGLMATLTISDTMLSFALPLLIGSVVLLWLVLIDKKFTKTEAALFLLAYFLFIGKLFYFI